MSEPDPIESPGPLLRWPGDLLEKYPLEGATKQFLSSEGLPQFLPGMTLEFGVFDSDGPDLLIGDDCGFPIYVDSASGAVFHSDSPGPGRRCMINSSVRQLAYFIQRIFDPSHDDEDGETWAKILLEELKTVDAPALQSWDDCMWPALIDRFQLNIG